jgi:hypothetical protein
VDPAHQQFVIPSGQVSPADASGKEDIAAEENLVICRVETDTSGAVAGNEKDAKGDFAEYDFGSFFNQKIRLNGFRFQKEPEFFEKLGVSDKGNSISMIGDLASESSFDLGGVIDVVDMAVSDQQQVESDRQITHPIRGTRGCIDENVAARHLKQIGVGIKNTPNKRLKVKHSE